PTCPWGSFAANSATVSPTAHSTEEPVTPLGWGAVPRRRSSGRFRPLRTTSASSGIRSAIAILSHAAIPLSLYSTRRESFAAIASDSEPRRPIRRHVQMRRLPVEHLGHELPRRRGHRQAEHVVPRRDQYVRHRRAAVDDWQAVVGHG